MSRFINPVPQFWLNDGTLAVSGKMVFFENGDYSTKKNTYANSALTTANTNPVTLDGQGRMPACFGEGLYSVKFYAYDNTAVDNLGTLQWTRDDVSLSDGGGEFSDWSAVATYSIGAAVKDNGEYYILYGSATSKGERPSTTPAKWEQITFLTVFNASKAAGDGYATGEIVVTGGFIYRSLVDANSTTPPSADWANLTFNDSISGDFSIGGNLSVTGDTAIAGNAKVESELQIGADAGDNVTIRDDGFMKINAGAYEEIATVTTVTGKSFVELSDAAAVAFPRINADGTVTQRSASEVLADLSITNQPEITLTMNADWTVDANLLKAKVVYGILYVYGVVTQTGAGTIAATLPVNYRPAVSRSVAITSQLWKPAQATVATNGEISVLISPSDYTQPFNLFVTTPL